jgi:putative effector of murein hydrolase
MFLPPFKQNAVSWFQNFVRVISTLCAPALLALAIPMVQKRSLLVQVFLGFSLLSLRAGKLNNCSRL